MWRIEAMTAKEAYKEIIYLIEKHNIQPAKVFGLSDKSFYCGGRKEYQGHIRSDKRFTHDLEAIRRHVGK